MSIQELTERELAAYKQGLKIASELGSNGRCGTQRESQKWVNFERSHAFRLYDPTRKRWPSYYPRN